MVKVSFHSTRVLLQVAKKEGATVLTGGKRPPSQSKGFFVEPTIFTDVSPDMTVWREEVSSCFCGTGTGRSSVQVLCTFGPAALKRLTGPAGVSCTCLLVQQSREHQYLFSETIDRKSCPYSWADTASVACTSSSAL